MSRTILHSELLNPIFVSITVISVSEAIAQASPTARETPKLLQSQTDALSLESSLALNSSTSTRHNLYTCEGTRSPVPSVNQLSDVQQTDWAFQALQSLVEP